MHLIKFFTKKKRLEEISEMQLIAKVLRQYADNPVLFLIDMLGILLLIIIAYVILSFGGM